MKDKVVLITGGSGDIGGVIAERIAQTGATVCLHYSKNLKKALRIKGERRNIHLFKQNFKSKKLTLISDIVEKFGRIDALINCAGILGKDSILYLTPQELDNIFLINTKVPYLLSSEVFKIMKRQKNGRIINISSFAVKYGMGRNSTIQYAGSKAALECLTTGLSRLGAKYNILVNSIRPGVIESSMQRNRDNLTERINMIPLQRSGKPEDIAEMVAYLLSEKGSFITGETITIAGGE